MSQTNITSYLPKMAANNKSSYIVYLKVKEIPTLLSVGVNMAGTLSQLHPDKRHYEQVFRSIQHVEGPLKYFPDDLLKLLVRQVNAGGNQTFTNSLWPSDRSLYDTTAEIARFQLRDNPDLVLSASRFSCELGRQGRKRQIVVVEFPETDVLPCKQAIVTAIKSSERFNEWHDKPRTYARCCRIWGSMEQPESGSATHVMLLIRKAEIANATKAFDQEIPLGNSESTTNIGAQGVPFLGFDPDLRFFDFEANGYTVQLPELEMHGIKYQDIEARIVAQDFGAAIKEYNRIRHRLGGNVVRKDWAPPKNHDLAARNLFMFSMWVVQRCREDISNSEQYLTSHTDADPKAQNYAVRLKRARCYENQYLALMAELIGERPSDSDLEKMKKNCMEGRVIEGDVVDMNASDEEDSDDPDYVDSRKIEQVKAPARLKREYSEETIDSEVGSEGTGFGVVKEEQQDQHQSKRPRVDDEGRKTSKPQPFMREQSEGSTIEVNRPHNPSPLSRATTIVVEPPKVKAEEQPLQSLEDFMKLVNFVFRDKGGRYVRVCSFESCRNAAKLFEHAIVAKIASKTTRMLEVQIASLPAQPISCDNGQQFEEFIISPLTELWREGLQGGSIKVVVAEYW